MPVFRLLNPIRGRRRETALGRVFLINALPHLAQRCISIRLGSKTETLAGILALVGLLSLFEVQISLAAKTKHSIAELLAHLVAHKLVREPLLEVPKRLQALGSPVGGGCPHGVSGRRRER